MTHIYINSAYENFSQASNFNLVQIVCKLTYIPYANNSVLKIRKPFQFSTPITFNTANQQISHESFTMTTVGSCFELLNKTIDSHFTKINCFDLKL